MTFLVFPQAPAPMAFPMTTPQVPVYGMVSFKAVHVCTCRLVLHPAAPGAFHKNPDVSTLTLLLSLFLLCPTFVSLSELTLFVSPGSSCVSLLLLVSLSKGSSPDGSDGRSASDGSSADDVQPACSQTHQPLHAHARSPGQLTGIVGSCRI